MTDQLMTRADVAEMFQIGYKATYRIKGIEACRVEVPGVQVVRFDRAKVLALLTKKKPKAA